MAATDQTYRPQRKLDIVFGASCLLMLASVVWMFAQDYNREFKVEQRDFRDVEEAMAERALLRLVPDQENIEKVHEAEKELAAARAERDQKRKDFEKQNNDLLPQKVKAEARAQAVKADYDSTVSLYNIEVEKRNAAPPGSSRYRDLEASVDRLRAQVNKLANELAERQAEVEKIKLQLDEIKRAEKDVDDRVSNAEDKLKELTADFDRFAKLAVQKRWKTGDWFRSLPVLDAFASPTRIQQFTLNDLPIDYNFKYVTRYDRCMTCHLGIDRAAYTRTALHDLTGQPSPEVEEKLNMARDLVRQRRQTLHDPNFTLEPNELSITQLKSSELTDERINEYCVHPRMDLFVDGNSAHPAEKFGCTICHGGQGSATDFNLASHTPNNATERRRWTNKEDWEPNHYWDFPMLPKRFLESSCLKCHYQVTDLLPQGEATEIREAKPVDTPGAKVVRGYNLVRELGCFGCHEIAGTKGGREVGPDLRLEPVPPLEGMTPSEQAKMLSDPLNLPGTQRKVGPSLRRISEKTNQEWARKWLRSPRAFRPDTRMPHFYGLSNNSPDVLPADQKEFPDAEIHSIIYYVFRESTDYLQGKDTYYQTSKYRKKELEDKKKNGLISEREMRDLEEMTRRLEIARVPVPLKEKLTSSDGKSVELPATAANAQASQEQMKAGRQLFTEKGCLACHKHRGTGERLNDLPPVKSEAEFGPDLSRLTAKLAPENSDGDGKRRWLVQWIMNPRIHSSRTLMPITHLNETQAAAVAAWLLSQEAQWNEPDVPGPKVETLESMARIYLLKTLPRTEVDRVLADHGLSPDQEKEIRNENREADELRLAITAASESWDNKLKWYVGKKAISQLGCFACHEVPGFESAKPIGTPLNDWGKKDPERIAFEDVISYVKTHHYVTDGPTGTAEEKEAEEGKTPYERFFWDALSHHQREGFLNQKLREPRSYDYERLRSWEDRLRMPQFKFARGPVKALEGETDEQTAERADAESREAVMTFILGLVAEPVPQQYVYDAAPDQLAIAKGRKVLDKYNCAGCHQLEAGSFQFKASPGVLEELEGKYKRTVSDPSYQGDDFKLDDPSFGFHNAWAGVGQKYPDRLLMHGLPTKEDEQDLSLRLTEALRFTNTQKQTQDIPAAEDFSLPVAELLSRTNPHGGRFVDLLVPYLIERKEVNLDDPPKARSGLPPPLLREGEKVQPEWLFQFLRNPYPIRPQHGKDARGNVTGVTILRMPRFNMSDDEATTLVNYFGAMDQLKNPAAGIKYPYVAVQQRDDGYLAGQTQTYVPKLGAQLKARTEEMQPIWKAMLEERVKEASEDLKAAEKAVAATKEEDKKTATKKRDDLKAELDKLKEEQKRKDDKGPFLSNLLHAWESQEAYATDAYRLLANYNLCLKCHQVGNLEPNQAIGPPLAISSERLRPDWTRRWIASPQRLLIYPVGNHPMPQPFARGKIEYEKYFSGTALEKATALRDILMNFPKVASMPANRNFRPTEGGQ